MLNNIFKSLILVTTICFAIYFATIYAVRQISTSNGIMSESSKIYDAYVDGSFSAKFDKGSWAYTIVDNETDKSIAEGVGLLNYTLQPELRKLRNIATECRAVIEALDYASVYNMRLNIYYDYIGLQRWVWDITENQTPWQCKNDFTWEYRQV